MMANQIRELREKMGMSQIHLSIELNVSQETVSAYESGKNFPRYAILVKMPYLKKNALDEHLFS